MRQSMMKATCCDMLPILSPWKNISLFFLVLIWSHPGPRISLIALCSINLISEWKSRVIKHKNSIKLFLHKEVSATLPSHSEDKKKYIHIIATTLGQSYVLPLIYLPDNIKINQRLDNQMFNISIPPNFLQVNLDALTNFDLFLQPILY